MAEQASLLTRSLHSPWRHASGPAHSTSTPGQRHLVGPGKILRRLIESDHLSSMIFWGPPGVGKTTLAHIIATHTKASFITFSAVTSAIKDIRAIMQKAEDNRRYGARTIVFVDEIHRFNKAQQGAFLPFAWKPASIILIGATTENPSFEVNGARLSRCRVFVLRPLGTEDIESLLRRALTDRRGFGSSKVIIGPELVHAIAEFANGDARTALSTLEMAVLNGDQAERRGPLPSLRNSWSSAPRRNRSSMTKTERSITISSPPCTSPCAILIRHAAVYWLARMLEAGEDPLYIARRVLRFAAEDVGLADPNAIVIASAAYQACHYLGMPECNVHLTEAVIYLSLMPRSNAMETAYNLAKQDAVQHLAEPVPLVIRNAPTGLMKNLGYGKGYQYAHDAKDKLTSMQCLPDSLLDRVYYQPTDQGLEVRFKDRLAKIKAWKKSH